MNTQFTRLAFIFLLTLAVGCKTSARKEEQAFGRAAAVNNAISEIISDQEVPGISFAVFNDEKVLFQKSLGTKNTSTGEQVDAFTVFEAASLSKTLFAYLAVRAIERGSLTLHTPLSTYWLDNALEGDSRHRQLTPLNLLSHTSGLPNWRGAPQLQATRVSDLFLPDDTLKIEFEPGTKFSYSGEGYLYLQQVLEKLTGQTLSTLAKEEVFLPLEMSHSSFVFDEAISRNFATGHDTLGKASEKYKPRIPLAAASLHTTAGEYARFLVQLVKKVEAGGAYKNMIEEVVVAEEKNDYRVAWGIGVGIMEFQNKRYLFHWGDNGVFKSYYLYCLEDKLGFVYFANGEKGLTIRNKLSQSVFGHEIPMWPENYVE